IIPLAEQLLARHARKQNRRHVVLDASARRALVSYRWPGNVRELDNIMQRALILQQGRSINEKDLGLVMTNSYSEKPSLLCTTVHTSSALLPIDANDSETITIPTSSAQ